MATDETSETQGLVPSDMGSLPQAWVPRFNLVAPGPIDMFPLREDQIRRLAAPNTGIVFGLFTLFAGLAVAFYIVIETVDALSDRQYAGFLAAVIAFAGLAVIALAGSIREYLGVRSEINHILPKRTRNQQ